jgi:hypothetical protein
MRTAYRVASGRKRISQAFEKERGSVARGQDIVPQTRSNITSQNAY